MTNETSSIGCLYYLISHHVLCTTYTLCTEIIGVREKVRSMGRGMEREREAEKTIERYTLVPLIDRIVEQCDWECGLHCLFFRYRRKKEKSVHCFNCTSQMSINDHVSLTLQKRLSVLISQTSDIIHPQRWLSLSTGITIYLFIEFLINLLQKLLIK